MESLSAHASAGPAGPPVRLLVGTLAAAACAGAFATFGLSEFTLIVVPFIAVLAALAAVDLEERRIPNVIVLPATGVIYALQLALFPEHAVECAVAAIGAGAFLLVLALVQPGGLGMGDVKLAIFLGAGLGYSVLGALTIGALAAAAVGMALLVLRGRAARRYALPFAPFLAAGAVVMLFA